MVRVRGVSMKISVKTNIKKISKGLTKIKKQIPFATMMALNDTAFAVHRAEKKQTTQKFDNPTTFTQKGFRVEKAKKTNLKAEVYVEKKREDYMKLEVDGGIRTAKNTAIVTPNKKNSTDIGKYPSGNINKGSYNIIKRNKKKYFFGVPKGNQGTDGIWERYGREATGTVSGAKIRQVARLHKNTKTYKAIFPFETIGQGVAFSRKNGFESHYSKRLKYALRTAK